jgi:hypothetical protein
MYHEEWNRVVPFSNSTSHILLLRLFEKFDGRIWDAAVGQVPFHKLSYKNEVEKSMLKGTYYEHILKRKL